MPSSSSVANKKRSAKMQEYNPNGDTLHAPGTSRKRIVTSASASASASAASAPSQAKPSSSSNTNTNTTNTNNNNDDNNNTASRSSTATRRAVVDVNFEPDTSSIFQSQHSLCEDEQFSEDEKALNAFVVQHPMLSLEATSQKSLQLLSNLFHEQANFKADRLPVVPKSYDDTMLRPPNKSLNERECVCGDRCMCNFLALLRHGQDTDLAFTCVEFLLPSERDAFVQTGVLPTRRKKCLLCTRYYVSYLYYKCRMDPQFSLRSLPATPQPFANQVMTNDNSNSNSSNSNRVDADEDATPDERVLLDAQRDASLCSHSSPVSVRDGYHMSSLLFVDENEFYKRQNAKGTPLTSLFFQPIVRFDSKHYEFYHSDDGTPMVRQVGIGCDEDRLFRPPPLE